MIFPNIMCDTSFCLEKSAGAFLPIFAPDCHFFDVTPKSWTV